MKLLKTVRRQCKQLTKFLPHSRQVSSLYECIGDICGVLLTQNYFCSASERARRSLELPHKPLSMTVQDSIAEDAEEEEEDDEEEKEDVEDGDTGKYFNKL